MIDLQTPVALLIVAGAGVAFVRPVVKTLRRNAALRNAPRPGRAKRASGESTDDPNSGGCGH